MQEMILVSACLLGHKVKYSGGANPLQEKSGNIFNSIQPAAGNATPSSNHPVPFCRSPFVQSRKTAPFLDSSGKGHVRLMNRSAPGLQNFYTRSENMCLLDFLRFHHVQSFPFSGMEVPSIAP